MMNLGKYKNKLADTLKQYTTLDEIAINKMLPNINLTVHKKGEILLRQGYKPDNNYYIVEGCVRQYLTGEEGKEVTVEFYKEDQSINVYSYLDEDNNSLYSLECLENCVMTPCSHIVDEDIEDTYPEISKMIKFFNRSQTTNLQKNYAMFKMMTPEERFMQFVASEPDLMKRVPQNILASYINITPETFSRFKKRLVQ